MKRNHKIAVDTSALIAYADRDIEAVAMFAEYARRDVLLLAPAPIFAESLRGNAKDAGVHRALAKLEPVATTTDAGRRAGELLGTAKASAALTVDALIIATAIDAGATGIITADADDHRRLAPGGFEVAALHDK